ncbi:hypothetical protein V2A60_007420 [Cordyceps javanica]
MLTTLLSTTAALLLAFVAQPAAATRSDGTPICDYYAKEKYGGNTKDTQLRLMSSIVAHAYSGGPNSTKFNNTDTGIFNMGSSEGEVVHLKKFFDGTTPTTNFNDAAIKTDWLDGGGLDPLLAYLNGTTKTTLFTHWYVAFGRIYGCTKVEEFLDQPYRAMMPAYVHKYMDLKKHEVSYFIRQLTAASKQYGFTDSDANSLEQVMNGRYNIRCAPAEKNTLYSICLDEDCPLAFPKSDCTAYKNIAQYAVDEKPTESPGAGAGAASSKSDLGGGAIAGIVVGAVAGVGLIIGALWFVFNKKRNGAATKQAGSMAVPPQANGGGYHNPALYSPAMTQSHFDMGGGGGGQYDSVSQSPYDPSRHSQFTYFSQNRESQHTTPNSPPPPGWVEMPPQELHATEIAAPTTPPLGSAPGSPTKLGYKPDVREVMEMESPPPITRSGSDYTTANPEQRSNHQ